MDNKKLVSRNSVQKFKQDKQIQYYQIGGTAIKIIRGWRDALFPWLRPKPTPQPQENKEAVNRTPETKKKITVDPNILYLLVRGYKYIEGKWMSPEEQKEYWKNKRKPQQSTNTPQQSSTQQSDDQQSSDNTTNDSHVDTSSNNISFTDAFNNARNSGQKEFIWNGGRYNTKKKGEEDYVFSNGKWVNPNIVFTVPPITEPTQEEMDELNRRAKPIGTWEGASFAKNGGTLKSYKNVIQRFRERK